MVKNYGAHANQNVIFNTGTVYNGVMPYGNIIADFNYRALIQSMQHCAILYVYLISNPYRVHITAYNNIEPETALISGNNVANNNRRFGYVTLFSQNRC